MRGCIELFEKVDPDVQIFAVKTPDIIYFKTDYEEWQAVQPESQKEYG